MTHATRCLAGAALGALILNGCLALAARAEDAPPKAEAGTTAQSACIAEKDGWVREGRRVAFAIELINKCEQRFKCRVFAYVTNAKGAAQGRGTLRLAPAAKGAVASKHWSMKVRMAGGSAQTARECRVF